MHYLPENTSVNFELVLFKIHLILHNVDQIHSTVLYCVSLEGTVGFVCLLLGCVIGMKSEMRVLTEKQFGFVQG